MNTSSRASGQRSMNRSSLQDRLVKLDIGGMIFITSHNTLKTIPHTRLSKLCTRSKNYDPVRDLYYFDRNPVMFMSILDCYRFGEFHHPPFICLEQVKEELKWWGIPDEVLPLCCKRTMDDHDLNKAATDDLILEFEHDFDAIKEDARKNSRLPQCFLDLWLNMEYPNYSRPAKVWAICLGVLTVISVMTLGVGYHKAFRDEIPGLKHNETHLKIGEKFIAISGSGNMISSTTTKPWMQMVDKIVNSVLTAEVLFRFLVSPHKIVFFKSTLNWIDILAAITFWSLTVVYSVVSRGVILDPRNRSWMSVMLLFLCMRVLRIFRLSTVIRDLKVLTLVMSKNIKELFTLCTFLAIAMNIFSLLIFYAELEEKSSFPDLVTAFWWSVVSMTSVGYGDQVPKSYQGYVVGMMCAVVGLLLAGLSIPIISNNFTLFYTIARSAHRKEKEQRGRREKMKQPSVSATTKVRRAFNKVKCSANVDDESPTNKDELL